MLASEYMSTINSKFELLLSDLHDFFTMKVKVNETPKRLPKMLKFAARFCKYR